MPVFYIRNDDVNVLDDELVAVTSRCADEGVPITHAVEPANLTDEATQWLREVKARDPRLLEIMQHGFDHQKRDRGEFGGVRPYDDQLNDLSRGKEIMLEAFAGDLFPCLNFPFGPYNRHSMRAADRLGFRVVSSHYNSRRSRRMWYALGHALNRGLVLGRHVSYHLDFYPGTGMFCVDMAVSVIERYLGEYGSRTCVFHPLEEIKRRIDSFVPHTPVIGLLLHHRYHTDEASLDLITDVIRYARSLPDSTFMNIDEVYRHHCPAPGEGFRDVS